MSEILLTANRKQFSGWTSIRVDQSLDRIAGTFNFEAAYVYGKESDFEVATEYAGGKAEKFDTHFASINSTAFKGMMGAEAVITVDGQSIMQGYIDYFPIHYDDKSHNLWLSGRDKVADIVDCSYTLRDGGKNEWKDQKMVAIIGDLCRPFGITAYIDSSAHEPVYRTVQGTYKVKEGEYVYEPIKNLCKQVGVFPVCYGDGKLTITKIGPTLSHDNLKLGLNIKAGQLEQSNRDRYSKYIVKGQRPAEDDNELEKTTRVVGHFDDPIFTRYRPRVILTEGKATEEICNERAEWEARVSAGKSRELTYTVQGWLQTDGSPWQLNSMILVEDSFLGINEEFVISGLSFQVGDDTGTITRITLSHPAKYAVLDDDMPVGNVKTEFDS